MTPHSPTVSASERSRPPLCAVLRDALEILNTPFRHVQDALRFPRSESRAAGRLRDQLAGGGAPVVVYSATKTASTAVAAAIERTPGLSVTKVHFLQPEHFWAGPLSSMVAPDGLLRHRAIEQRTARRLLLLQPPGADRPLRTVSVFRDPIAFNLSNYTYFGRAYWMRTTWRRAPWMSTEQLLSHFLGSFPHESASLWWTHEFQATTGIDPLTEGFDAERGWQRYRRGRFDCLLLRADLPDEVKREAVAGFLGVSLGPLQRENQNESQAAPGVYERLRSAIRSRPDYVERMMALPASRAFFTPAQRSALTDRWLACPS